MKKLSLLLFFLSFFACKSDPCENTLCDNNGTCIDGRCDCPEPWFGLTCNALLDAEGFRVKSLTVSNYPLVKPDGSDWDTPDTNPDIFLEIVDLSSCTPALICSLEIRTDVILNTEGPITFDFSNESIFLSLDKFYSINFFDMDKLGAEFMASEIIIGPSIIFDLKDNMYPTTFNFDFFNLREIDIVFDVEYQF